MQPLNKPAEQRVRTIAVPPLSDHLRPSMKWGSVGQLVLLAAGVAYALCYTEAPWFAVLGFAGLVASRIFEPTALVPQVDSDSDHED